MPKTSNLPKGWPPEILYLTKPVYSKAVSSSSLQLRNNTGLAKINNVVVPYNTLQIETITIPSHPANGQRGLFATKPFKPDSFICFYFGLVHGESDTDHSSNYDLRMDRELQLSVDATKMGNESRFINDYRGINDEGPNVEFRDCVVNLGGGLMEKRVGVFVLPAGRQGKRSKGIQQGEEILVNYGKGFWAHRSGF